MYYCNRCGSQAVECTAWVNMNTDEISSSGNEGPSEAVYCRGCEQHGTLADVREVSDAEVQRVRRQVADKRRYSEQSPASEPARGFRPFGARKSRPLRRG